MNKCRVVEGVYLFHLLSAISKRQVSTFLSVGGKSVFMPTVDLQVSVPKNLRKI